MNFSPYASESDLGAPGRPFGYPIPDVARTRANYIEGGVAGGGTTGDRHLILIDRDRWLLYETWATRWNAGLNRWEAGSGATFDLAANTRRPDGWTSADAAGLAIFPVSSVTRCRSVRSDHACVPRHDPATERLCLAGGARRGQHGQRSPNGRAPRLKPHRHQRLPGRRAEDLPGDEDLRSVVARTTAPTCTCRERWTRDGTTRAEPCVPQPGADDFEVVSLGWGEPMKTAGCGLRNGTSHANSLDDVALENCVHDVDPFDDFGEDRVVAVAAEVVLRLMNH